MELPVAVGIIYNSIEHAMATGTNRYSLGHGVVPGQVLFPLATPSHHASAVPGCYSGNNPYPGTVDGRWLARSSTVNFKYELTSHQQSLG